jgi:hypothetical protein
MVAGSRFTINRLQVALGDQVFGSLWQGTGAREREAAIHHADTLH